MSLNGGGAAKSRAAGRLRSRVANAHAPFAMNLTRIVRAILGLATLTVCLSRQCSQDKHRAMSARYDVEGLVVVVMGGTTGLGLSAAQAPSLVWPMPKLCPLSAEMKILEEA